VEARSLAVSLCTGSACSVGRGRWSDRDFRRRTVCHSYGPDGGGSGGNSVVDSGTGS
jgi:hypothetical protein